MAQAKAYATKNSLLIEYSLKITVLLQPKGHNTKIIDNLLLAN